MHIFSYYGPPLRVPPNTTIYWSPHRAAPEEGSAPLGFSADESAVRSKMLRDGTATRLTVYVINEQPEDGGLTVAVRQDASVARHGRDPEGAPLAVTIGPGESGGGYLCLDVLAPYDAGDTLAVAFTNHSLTEYSAPIIQFGLCYDAPQYEAP